MFLDWLMPVMGGFEVVSELGGAPLPIIVIVTALDRRAVDEAFEAGAIDCLLKPVGEARLRKALERACAVWSQFSPATHVLHPPAD